MEDIFKRKIPVIMKHLTIILVALFSLTNVYAQDNEGDKTGPKAEFDRDVIDYGEIEKNSNGVRKFTFTNVGDEPLVIKSADGSCGCTVPTKPEKPIQPGESSFIKVKYATNRVGSFSKSVTLTTNGKPSRKVLRIRGEVKPPPKKEGNMPLKKDESVVESDDSK